MKKKKSLIVTLGLVGLIAGSTLLYNLLADNYENNNEETIAIEEQADSQENLIAEVTTEESEVQDSENDLTAEEETTNTDEELTLMESSDITDSSDNLGTVPTEEATTAPAPTQGVTNAPTQGATSAPTQGVTNAPTQSVTNAPTQGATSAPTQGVTNAPTNTVQPTTAPTKAPTAAPTTAPTKAPVNPVPTNTPVPTATPIPTIAPTKAPVNVNTAADFTVQTYSGSNVSLSSNFGKPIVINFWASWCGPCRSEMADFNAVYKEYKDKVVFMMVDMVDGSRETKEDGYSYVTSQGFSFPVYYDVKQSAAYAYGINSYPTTYFINANGNVSTYSKGAMSASTLRNQLNKLINQ